MSSLEFENRVLFSINARCKVILLDKFKWTFKNHLPMSFALKIRQYIKYFRHFYVFPGKYIAFSSFWRAKASGGWPYEQNMCLIHTRNFDILNLSIWPQGRGYKISRGESRGTRVESRSRVDCGHGAGDHRDPKVDNYTHWHCINKYRQAFIKFRIIIEQLTEMSTKNHEQFD